MTRTRFDELFDEAAPRVLAGRHDVDAPPPDGGRWGVTVVLRVPDAAARTLGALTEEAARFAGPRHFRTGHPDAVHVTVRALDAYRDAADPTDPRSRRWLAAAARTAARTPPVQLTLTGLTLTPLAVIAQLEPAADGVGRLAATLACELGPDGGFEAAVTRTIVHSTLLHLTGDVADPAGFVGWVRERRSIDPVRFTSDRLDVVRFRHVESPDLRCMAPERWASCPLSGCAPAAR